MALTLSSAGSSRTTFGEGLALVTLLFMFRLEMIIVKEPVFMFFRGSF